MPTKATIESIDIGKHRYCHLPFEANKGKKLIMAITANSTYQYSIFSNSIFVAVGRLTLKPL